MGTRTQPADLPRARAEGAVDAPRDRVEALVSHVVFQRHTATTFADRASLEAELTRVGERGWAADNGEHDAYVMCVAAPIRDSRGHVIAAVSITAIEVIATLGQLELRLPLLLETADRVSRELGYTPAAA